MPGDADLIAIRMKLTGGRQVESEADRGTRAIKGTGTAADEASRQAVASTKVTSSAFRKQAAMLQATGRTMTYGVTAPLGLLGVVAVKTAVDFTKSMAQVGVATNTGGRQLEGLKDYALEMGASTIFSANEAAGAMLNLAKAGLTPAQIRGGALAATMNLAAAGSMDLAEAGNLVGSSMKTFSLAAGDSAKIADALAGGANKSAADVQELAYSLAQAGQSAKMTGLTIHETVGTLAAFADQGLRGSDAGTSLKTFLMRLNPTSKKAKELMNELGLSFFDASGNMVGMAEVSERLGVALRGKTQEERNAAIQVLFGSDAQRAANIVYTAGPNIIRDYTKATEEKGAAEKMAAAQMEGLPGAVERLKGSLETASLVMGEAMAPAIIFLAGGIEQLANAFVGLPEPVQTTIVAVGALAALAGPILWFAGSMAKAVIAIRELRAAEAVAGGGMLGKGKGMLGRLGGGLALGAGAQIGGDMVGGDLGNWLSKAGTGAGIGFTLAGPMGAAVGGTIGGVAAAVEKLTGAEKRLTVVQEKLARDAKVVKEGMDKQRVAGANLASATNRLHRANQRQKDALAAVRAARARVTRAEQAYGPTASQTITAERRLQRAIQGKTDALRRAQRAERKHGIELQQFKQIARTNVLNQRNEVNVLGRKKAALDRAWLSAKKTGAGEQRLNDLATRGQRISGRLNEAHKRLAQTLTDVAQKAGPKYATFLRDADRESIEYGSTLGMLKGKADGLASSLERIARMPPMPTFGGPGRVTIPGNAAGTDFWRGGLTLVGEQGPELVTLPRGSQIKPAPETRRLMAPVGDPLPSTRAAEVARGGGRDRFLVAAPVKIGRRAVAEVVVEAVEDDEARL